MRSKAVLLDQLSIDREPAPARPERRSRAMSRVIVATALIALVAAGAFAVHSFAKADSVPIREAVARPFGGEAEAGAHLEALLDAAGYVVAQRQAIVSAKSIYKVNVVLVQQGDRVTAGQILARLDDSNVRAGLEQANAQVRQLGAALAAARQAAADAQPGYRRDQQQVADGLISSEAFETRKASYDAAESAVTVARENLGVAQATVGVNLRAEDDTIIRAPFDGIVTSKNAQPGEIVSPQFLGGGGIVAIVDMDSLEVDVDVSENYISRVRFGQPATITLDAYPDWHIPAQVVAVIPTAERAKGTVQVRVGFNQKDARVLPQLGAHVSFLGDAPDPKTQSSAPRVLLPAAAVNRLGDKGLVYLISGKTVAARSVRITGHVGPDQIIVTGLEPGARAAIGDFQVLHPGAKVRIVN